MNTVMLVGRFASDVELKQTRDGKSVTSFSLAVKRPCTKDITDFLTVVAWEKKAEFICKSFKKGDTICIRGYLSARSYPDAQGIKRYATEVIVDEISFIESASKKCSPSLFKPGEIELMPGGIQQQIPISYGGAPFEDIPNDERWPF